MGSVLSRDLILDLSSTEKKNLKWRVFLFLFKSTLGDYLHSTELNTLKKDSP